MDFFDFENMQYVLGNVSRNLMKLDDVITLSSVIGCAVDEWCAAKGIPSEAALEIFENLARVQKEIYELYGPADYIAQ